MILGGVGEPVGGLEKPLHAIGSRRLPFISRGGRDFVRFRLEDEPYKGWTPKLFGEPQISDHLECDVFWITNGFLAPAYGFTEWVIVSQGTDH